MADNLPSVDSDYGKIECYPVVMFSPAGVAFTPGQGVQSSAAASTSVASSSTVVNLLAANTARKGATIYNESTAVLYVKFGAAASATSYTVQVAANAYYEIPFGYTGLITGLWATANGNARVTELT